jgi:hypothetical protein
MLFIDPERAQVEDEIPKQNNSYKERFIMALTTKKLDHGTYAKAENFLRYAGEPMGDNMYCYQLCVQSSTDDGQMLDACLHLQDSKISVKTIWILENNRNKGTLSARDLNGERGSYAKILSQKYLNRFFEQLATVDADNPKEKQYITYDLVKKTEAEIDQSIDPDRITETDITAYDRAELIASALQALRYFYRNRGEEEYSVTYGDQIFNVALSSSVLGIKIPLADVVRKKWETGECFAMASALCANERLDEYPDEYPDDYPDEYPDDYPDEHLDDYPDEHPVEAWVDEPLPALIQGGKEKIEYFDSFIYTASNHNESLKMYCRRITCDDEPRGENGEDIRNPDDSDLFSVSIPMDDADWGCSSYSHLIAAVFPSEDIPDRDLRPHELAGKFVRFAIKIHMETENRRLIAIHPIPKVTEKMREYCAEGFCQ